MRRLALEPTLAVALAPHRVDDVIALRGLRQERLDHLRRVLEVAVHRHHGVPGRKPQARAERDLVAEVPAEADRPDPVLAVGGVLEQGPARVAGPVVDEDHLPLPVERIERARQAGDQIEDHGSLVPDRQHDAELHGDSIILQRSANFFGAPAKYHRSMAVTSPPKLDAPKLRADFPIFEQEINGKPLAYLDSAVSTHKPRQVLDKLRDFYERSYANVHRGVYTLSERSTAEYEGARQKIAQYVNAASPREIVFVRGATEGLNLVAYAWGLVNLEPGDLIVVTELEHHSNFVPWQYMAKRTGATLRMIELDENGELDLSVLDSIAAEGNVKVVANNLVSNALGTINPIEKLSAWAHDQGAIMVVDGAQAAPHKAVD